MTKKQIMKMKAKINAVYGMLDNPSPYLDTDAVYNIKKVHDEFKSTLITRLSYMAMRCEQYSTGIHSKKRLCEFSKSLELELTEVIIPLLKELNSHERK